MSDRYYDRDAGTQKLLDDTFVGVPEMYRKKFEECKSLLSKNIYLQKTIDNLKNMLDRNTDMAISSNNLDMTLQLLQIENYRLQEVYKDLNSNLKYSTNKIAFKEKDDINNR